MTITAVQLAANQFVSTGSVTVYTVPANTKTVIKEASYTNTSSVTATKVTLNFVPSGGSVTTANVVTPGVTVAQLGIYLFPELVNKVMGPGTFIAVKDDVGGLGSFEASGMQIV